MISNHISYKEGVYSRTATRPDDAADALAIALTGLFQQ